MNQEIIDKLQYSYAGQNDACPLPLSLKDSLTLISEFFKHNITNKLCLVFPSKEYAAQWLSVPIVIDNINIDFQIHQKEIYNSYSKYKCGDKLILNQGSIVEWAYKTSNNITFKVKDKSGCETFFSLGLSGAFKLQPAPKSKNKISSLERVKRDLPKKKKSPIDKILDIDSYGNTLFQKSSICLISKFKHYDSSIENVLLNQTGINDYFKTGKIDENGRVAEYSPFLVTNSFSNLIQYLTESISVSKIIIDGFSIVTPRGDFADIDRKFKIPTILITDLSEIEYFEDIKNFGFEFFNFSKENLKFDRPQNHSTFHSLDKKLRKYVSFNLIKEICHNTELETIMQKIYSIEQDESNSDLNTLRITLFQLANLVSRIAHIPSAEEISNLNTKVNSIESLFLRSRMWLGDSHKPVKESILLLKSIIEKIASTPSEKCLSLKDLLNSDRFDYIICPTEEEAKALKIFIYSSAYTHRPKVISTAEVNDNLLSNYPVKAILIGWAKSNNMNRILHSFLFSELILLFYEFENKYYNSLQRRNKKYNENILATIDKKGILLENKSKKSKGFNDMFSVDEIVETTSEISFDILDFELTLDSAQYSRYKSKGNLIESIKAKRIDFENDYFIYSTESHKFLLLNELIEKKGEKTNLYRKKIETLNVGDVIALINTERDILVELIEKNTNTKELVSVKQWTELWKNLLKEYYSLIGNDFKKLVNDLRKNGCKKHEATIRAWLQDENRIGPDDNADLISIAIMTNSKLLNDNINTVRESISKMKGWRMKASDFITDKIKSQIHEFADSSIINKRISIEGLGSVIVLKVIGLSYVWENIDIRYVNRLLGKEIV